MPGKSGHMPLATRLRIEAHAVWLAARDPRTPWHVRLFALAIAAYALIALWIALAWLAWSLLARAYA